MAEGNTIMPSFFLPFLAHFWIPIFLLVYEIDLCYDMGYERYDEQEEENQYGE